MTTGADDSYAREQELKEQRARWEQQRKARKEQEERDQKRAELEAHLQRRAKLWSDTTGSPPGTPVLERWTQEFVDNKHAEKQAEKQAKIARSMDDLGI